MPKGRESAPRVPTQTSVQYTGTSNNDLLIASARSKIDDSPHETKLCGNGKSGTVCDTILAVPPVVDRSAARHTPKQNTKETSNTRFQPGTAQHEVRHAVKHSRADKSVPN